MSEEKEEHADQPGEKGMKAPEPDEIYDSIHASIEKSWEQCEEGHVSPEVFEAMKENLLRQRETHP